jgi:hypothetical protein
MKTDIPRIRKRLGNGRVLVCFPSGEKRVMRIDEYLFSMERKGYH